ncbi:MAG: hypothetical protein OXI66_01920 [Boseongicola sp.]|nr:hypothetical protein [Boseongicola sp.]
MFFLCFDESGMSFGTREKAKSKSDHRVDGRLRVRLHAMHVSRQLGPFSGGGRRCCVRCGLEGVIFYTVEIIETILEFRNAQAACQHYRNTAPRRRKGNHSFEPWSLANLVMTQVAKAQGILAFAVVRDACIAESQRLDRMLTKEGEHAGTPSGRLQETVRFYGDGAHGFATRWASS